MCIAGYFPHFSFNVPWLGEGLSMPCLSQSVLCCPLPDRVAPVFAEVVSPCGLQVVTREVHRSSLRRLTWPAQDHFIFLTLLIISMIFVLSLTQMLVILSLYVMLSILLDITFKDRKTTNTWIRERTRVIDIISKTLTA